nr:MAG TPA: hypothetical protein [Bacteriophage sp.]
MVLVDVLISYDTALSPAVPVRHIGFVYSPYYPLPFMNTCVIHM